MAPKHQTFDTLIIGAGPVGLIAAIAFVRAGQSVALVAPSPRATRSGRTVALMQGSVEYLQSLDLWEMIAPHTAPLARMTLIDDTGSLFRPPPAIFNATEIKLPAFGYNIEVDQLVAILESSAATQKGLVRLPSTVNEVSCDLAHGSIGNRPSPRSSSTNETTTTPQPNSIPVRGPSPSFPSPENARASFGLQALIARKPCTPWTTRLWPLASRCNHNQSSAKFRSTDRVVLFPWPAYRYQRSQSNVPPSSAKPPTPSRPSVPKVSISAFGMSAISSAPLQPRPIPAASNVSQPIDASAVAISQPVRAPSIH